MSKQAHRGVFSRITPLCTAALLLALAACSNDLASPAARAPQGRDAIKLLPSGKNLVSNSVKYRDTGAPHATGRSGSARLAGVAILGADGNTRLTITTGSLDDLGAAPGQIVKAQIKIFSPDGEHISTKNHNGLTGGGSQEFLLGALMPGARIQVQANVRGIDRNRTDVVTITATVRLAAALNVDVQLPGDARVGQPVVITGLVSEVNGDVGTRADCQLWVNGALVDQAPGIWVDAGDVVTCAFTHTFDRVGEQDVEVRVSTDGGSTSQGAVITSGGTVDVTGGFTTGFSGQVEDRSVSTTTVFDYTWTKPDGSHKEYSSTEVNAQRTQSMNVQGTIERAVVFPLARVDLAMESNGVEWQTELWEGLLSTVDATGRQCMTRDMPAYGGMFFLCNGLQGGASWGYQRFAGNVTYHGYGYSNVFDGIAGTQALYSWNDRYTIYASGGQVRALGSALLMRLTVRDAQGPVTISPVIPVAPFANELSVTPRQCVVTKPESLEGGSLTECRSARSDEEGWRGSGEG
ncbi:MAG TPA: hypothetical protein VEX86_07955 [Longimicrobium sp.]|nr:hypothetical protein [Longimicrobium sp.]